MNEVERYIIRFLVYGDVEAAGKVCYNRRGENHPECAVVIEGEGLEQALYVPCPGAPEVEQLPGGRYIIHTDIVYNTFFYISRAEELLNPRRDAHGRFLSCYSILGEGDRLQVPQVDVYSSLLLGLLGHALPPPCISRIYLTHDIDTIAHYRHVRGAIGGVLRGHCREVLRSLRAIRQDPAYTFEWLMAQDESAMRSQVESAMRSEVEMLYFVKHTRGRGKDYPQYNLGGRDYRRLKAYLTSHGARLGLHSSYYGGIANPEHYTSHRSHYLCCSIDRMQSLSEAGIRDDFTMGFADRAGFRLQTTRAVRWINPETRRLSGLTLHPLTVMDVTLTHYMGLSEEEAYRYCSSLIAQVRRYHGEAVLLWHNSNIAEDYHRTLYPKVLALL